ncbi:MspA family porin [Nocardia sp. NPDC004722]
MWTSTGLAIATAGLMTGVLLAAGPAGADTQVPLPGGSGEFTGPDGVVVQLTRSGEQADISGSMAASPLSRNVLVSAVASVTVTAPPGVTVTGGRIETGYLVGCQVDLGSKSTVEGSGNSAGNDNAKPGNGQAPGDNGGGNAGGGGGGGYGGGGLTVGTGDLGAGISPTGVTPSADPSMSLTLKPGKVGTKAIQTYTFTGTSGVTQYVGHDLTIDGCAGYAEARSYTTVLVQDNVMDVTQTLWGQPFSIG